MIYAFLDSVSFAEINGLLSKVFSSLNIRNNALGWQLHIPEQF